MSDELIVATLSENYISDLSKPKIDKFERAAILRNLLDYKQMSIRRFAEKYGFKRSTVEDWLLYNRITPAEYKEQIDKGLKPIEIYRSLRADKTGDVKFSTELDEFLDVAAKQMRRYISRGTITHETRRRANELKNEINRLLMRTDGQ